MPDRSDVGLQTDPADSRQPLQFALFQHPGQRRAMCAIALFEAVKGLAAMLAAFGLLELLHHDVHTLALALLWRFHLDPGTHYPELLLHYADTLNAINLRVLAPLATAYITLRWLEAYGLWKDKAWAEWLAALSTALYIPLETAHLVHRTTLVNAGVLLANISIVSFMAFQLWQRRH
jgi:uncharacterized membrane protein (DUF2068 family)